MGLAQRLYEGIELGEEGSVALITYMRTDSVNVSQDALQQVRELIPERFGSSYLPEKTELLQIKERRAGSSRSRSSHGPPCARPKTFANISKTICSSSIN